MEPIISPWIFYLISVSESLKVFSIIAAILIFILLLFLFGVRSETYDEEPKIELCKWIKISAISVVIFSFLSITLPSEQTSYNMLTAQYVTPNNIQNGKEAIVDMIREISTAVREGK